MLKGKTNKEVEIMNTTVNCNFLQFWTLLVW